MLSPWRHPVRRWRTRARKWHPGYPHHEVICCYEEWWIAQPRSERKRHPK